PRRRRHPALPVVQPVARPIGRGLQGERAMDDDPEVIRHQMADTRSSLTDKIERLEQTVTAKVQTTTAAVTDTVESVKEAVQDTVQTVRGTVTDTVDTVKEAFDVRRYFE